MDDMKSSAKHYRLLELYMRILEGEVIRKREEAIRYHVNERSIQRDLDDLKVFFFERGLETGESEELVYDRVHRGYRLQRNDKTELTNGEAMAVCKILLESRAFTKEEMDIILDKIINGCVPKRNVKQVTKLLANEKFYYIELQHKNKIIDVIWKIGVAIQAQKKMEIDYTRQDGTTVQRQVKPVGLMFSEYYFYLIALIVNSDQEQEETDKNDLFPTIYRIDRIKAFRVLQERFDIPYRNRFQEGEFRKRIQFMYGGQLQHIKFEYMGPSVEAILDRLPTAVIVKSETGKFVIQAETFGTGIEMWLRSQGRMVRLLEPQEMVQKFVGEIGQMIKNYE